MLTMHISFVIIREQFRCNIFLSFFYIVHHLASNALCFFLSYLFIFRRIRSRLTESFPHAATRAHTSLHHTHEKNTNEVTNWLEETNEISVPSVSRFITRLTTERASVNSDGMATCMA